MASTRSEPAWRRCLWPRGQRALCFSAQVARGTDDGRSDIDLLVVDNDDLRYFARLDKYYDELVDLLHRPVDLFVYREAGSKPCATGPLSAACSRGKGDL